MVIRNIRSEKAFFDCIARASIPRICLCSFSAVMWALLGWLFMSFRYQ